MHMHKQTKSFICAMMKTLLKMFKSLEYTGLKDFEKIRAVFIANEYEKFTSFFVRRALQKMKSKKYSLTQAKPNNENMSAI